VKLKPIRVWSTHLDLDDYTHRVTRRDMVQEVLRKRLGPRLLCSAISANIKFDVTLTGFSRFYALHVLDHAWDT
jgi:hypothetical protein